MTIKIKHIKIVPYYNTVNQLIQNGNMTNNIIQINTMFQHGEYDNHTTNPSPLQQTSKTKNSDIKKYENI